MVKVGITGGWEPGTVVEGWPLVYANKGLVECIERAGALPVVIPVAEDTRHMDEYMKMLDGVVISGEVLSIKRNVVRDIGQNVLENSNPIRYKNEKAAILSARRLKKPLLGICRGHQVLAVAEGGHVGDEDINEGNTVMHQQGGSRPPDEGVHEIHISPGTTLQKMLNRDILFVNSFHRQAVDRVPEGFRVCALSGDGRIEAMESVAGPFAMGIQFHPEMLKEEIWQRFFSEFVTLIREHQNKP